MGALWWWITAGSAAEITATFAEVEVIDDPATARMVESWSLDELDIADAVSGPLTDLYQKREQQRQDRAFGKILGKNRVYLRLPDPEEPATWWLTEHEHRLHDPAPGDPERHAAAARTRRRHQSPKPPFLF